MSALTLAEEISELQKGMMAQMPEDVLKLLMGKLEELIKSGLDQRAVKTGKAPLFTLPNATGANVSSEELLKNGPLVISFYRGGWCPYCNLELRAFQKVLPEIKELGAQYVAISPMIPDKSLSLAEKLSLEFHVLSDAGNKVAREFGLVFTLWEEVRPVYESFGFDLPGDNGDQSWELPIPATYVIGRDGNIVSSFVDADYTKRMEPSDVIAALKNIEVSK